MSYWGAIISAAADLYSNSQNQKGAKAGQEGAQAGLDWTKQVYQDAQGNFAPYLGAGQTGLNGLTRLANGDYSGFASSPDYQYSLEQMINANDHSAAARGRLYSGGYPADLAHDVNGLASQNLGNYRSSLQYLSTLGDTAASQLGSIGNGLAANVQNGYNNIASQQQSGYDSNGQLAGALGGIFNNWYQGQNNQNPYASSYSHSSNSSDPFGSGSGFSWDTYGGGG
jgi:hypothetical protein